MLIDPSELISSAEVAAMLRVQSATLTQWRCAKRGPAWIRCGRRVFYRREDVQVFLGRLRCDPTSTKSGAARDFVATA